VDSQAAGVPGFVDLHPRLNPLSWTDLPRGRFPEADSDFCGFHLVGELGRGAFGRVYLARQNDLAGRLVALKVSTQDKTEPHVLARLQHTHIVPVYSVHRAGPLQAVCMPYFGSATLADALRDLNQRKSPPESGKGLVSTIQDRAGRTRTSLEKASRLPQVQSASEGPQAQRASKGSPDSLACASGSHSPSGASVLYAVSPSALLADSSDKPTEAPPTLRMLEGLSHVEAVLWIGERLADGLAHAHERGILHRDLKPANILLTDDGQPMLLDFNLSADLHASASRARVGGTLPYMAPEHLASFAGLPATFPPGGSARAVADARSDVYGLGVILYELLAGQGPFEQPSDKGPELFSKMIAARGGAPPRLRTRNRNISPAVESIVRHCLEPDPARRYQSARQLAEDLHRQRSDRPLAFAREVSLKERSVKWLRRNRRRAVVAAALFAVLVFAGLAWTTVSRSQRLKGMEAMGTWITFRAESDEAGLRLAARPRDLEQRREGLRFAYQALARYDVVTRPDWTARPAIRRLPDEEQQRLRQAVGELALLAAGVEDTDEQRAILLQRAADCFPPDLAPRALFQARADHAGQQGNDDEANSWSEKAEARAVQSAADHYLLARGHLDNGRFVEAMDYLRQTVRLDPKHFAAWYQLGNCYVDGAIGVVLDDDKAISCFTTAISLRPDFYGSYFNRGLANQHAGKHADAEADFTAALERRPTFAVAHLHRGLARESQGQFRDALADFTSAIEIGDVPSRVWFARAGVRRKLGDKRGAVKDEREGMLHPPRDEESYVRRGVLRVPSSPNDALADFQAAVRLNPRSLPGLYNQALVYADKLGQPKKAIRALDEVVRQYPQRVEPLASRGVLRARLGIRKEALADAETARKLAPDSMAVRYQLACIHAHTSRVVPDDRDEAFRLLAQALSGGFGHALLDTDPDLEPLRADPRFRKLRAAVRALRTF
jgi:serine/threonine protein kinase/Tfp pilus assembly protein PilF